MKMLMRTMTLIAFVAISVQTHAQVSFGPKAGLNMATFSGDDTDDLAMKAGFQIGGVANIEFSDMLGLQPGLMLSTKGAQLDSDDFDGSVSLGYLEVPVNVVANFSGFQVFAGPYLGVGLFGTTEFGDDETDVQFVNDAVDADEDKAPYRLLDAGLNVGLGYKMGAIQIQAGYGLGLGNLNPKFDGEDPEDTMTNSVIQLTVAYFLGE